MHYEGNIFRPPAEHNSILLQITVGCSHNKCEFCGLYKTERFKIKEKTIIYSDIQYASKNFVDKKRLFLCDGDAMIVPHLKLLNILKEINKQLPWVMRIGVYANAKSLKRKTVKQLKELKKHRLGIVYLGLESGDDRILKKMNKGVDVATQIEQAKKVKAAGMKLSCTVLLGLGGRDHSKEHAKNTGKVLSEINPNYASALSLMIFPQIPLSSAINEGRFELISPKEMLEELKTMIKNTDLVAGIFSANHASNFLPLQIRLPGGKEEAIKLIDKALCGKISLKPDHLRAI